MANRPSEVRTVESAGAAEGFPLQKTDIHYDPVSGEVSLKREKFDGLVLFTKELVYRLQKVEDERDAHSFEARRSETTSNILTSLIEHVDQAREGIQRWLRSPAHSIRELSERTKIPYATCYRIVEERLGTSDVAVSELAKLLKATGIGASSATGGEDVEEIPDWLAVSALQNKRESIFKQLTTAGAHVVSTEASRGLLGELGKFGPEIVVFDASNTRVHVLLKSLRRKWKHQGRVCILTGVSKKKAAVAIEKVISHRTKAAKGGGD